MPRGKPMMQHWSREAVDFMRDAVAYCGYAEKLAAALRRYLPSDGHICDAGCGIGALSIELARHCRAVTAVDVSQAAIDALQGTGCVHNLHPVCADIFTMRPVPPYDGMVFCYFGRTEEILRIAKRQCVGTVVIVKRNCAEHRFSMGRLPQPQHRNETTRELLQSEHIPFRSESLSLELGQPFRSMDDALTFFRLYNKSDVAVTEELIAPRLRKTDCAEFPLYLPELREMEVFVLQAKDIPPHYAL